MPRWFCVFIFVFIPFGILWVSWICDLVFVTHFGKSSIIPSNISSAPCSFSSGILVMHILDHLISSETVAWYILAHTPLPLFSSAFHLENFFWPIFKFTDSFLVSIKPTELMKGNLHLCYRGFVFQHFHFTLFIEVQLICNVTLVSGV